MILEIWSLLLLCLVIGRRIACLLPSVMQRSIGFYVAPLLGLSFLVLFATLYGWLSPFKSILSIPFALGFAVIALAFEPRKRQCFHDSMLVLLFGTLCSLPIVAPMLLYGGYNPFTDAFTYLVQSQWLQSHSFAEKAVASGYYPALTQVVLYQTSGSRMGGSFFLGFVQSLFALKWSYDAYIATMSVSFVAGCLSMGGIIRQVVPVKKIVVLALSMLPAVSMNGFLLGAEWGFFPQTLGLAFALGLAALYPYLMKVFIRERHSWVRIAQGMLPASLCTAALLFAYNEPFPIFGAAMGLFMIIAAWTFVHQIKTIVLSFALYGLEVLVLINDEAIRIVKNLYQTLSISHGVSAIGWPVLWSPIQFWAHAFGLKTPFDKGVHFLDYVISTGGFLVFFVLLCVILYRFMRAHSKRRGTLIFLCCVELTLFLFFLKFRYLSPNMSPLEIGHTFLQFKISKYAAPFSLALGGIGWAIIWHYGKKYRAYLACFSVAVIVVGLLLQCLGVSRVLHRHVFTELQQRAPFNVLLDLRESVASIPKDDVIYVSLGEAHSKLRQMVAYVLYDRKIAGDYSDDGYILGHLPLNERVMSLKNANWLMTINTNSDTCDNKKKPIGLFLLQKKPFHYTMLEKQTGSYATESDANGNLFYWVPNAVDFLIRTTGTSHPFSFKFQLKSHLTPRTVLIQLKTPSGEVLMSKVIKLTAEEITFESPGVKTNTHRLILHVEADGQAARLSKHDAREARFIIKNIKLCSS